MTKQFYEKALPSQGVYCVAGIDQTTKKITQRFAETLDQLTEIIERFKQQKLNVFVALATFEGFSRKADDALFLRSFFIDLDVGQEKADQGRGYASKDEAHSALLEFVEAKELPPPVILDSGTGIHAYWLFDEDIPSVEWLPVAVRFKEFCIEGLMIDPVVTADVARIMRSPDTFNYKTDPPSPTQLLSEIYQYSFEEFRDFLGTAVIEDSTKEVLLKARGPLDEDTIALKKLANVESSFEKIAERSLSEDGCAQIKYAIENAHDLPEPVWKAALSIAQHCSDRDEAIHKLSEDYHGYSRERTEKKATECQDKPYSCVAFNDVNPGGCNGCPHRGKITNPLALGKVIKVAPVSTEIAVWEDADTETIPSGVVPDHPQALFPYFRGQYGGIYYQPSPKIDKNGVKHQEDAILIFPHELFPLNRMFSKQDGEIMTMRLILPHDPPRDFMMTTKSINSPDEFKKAVGFVGISASPGKLTHIMNYIMKWGHYLQSQAKADIVQMQMGWIESEDDTRRLGDAYVIGNNIILPNGNIERTPASPMVRSIAKHFEPKGTFEKWQECVNQLNRPSLEMHAFGTLIGLGSPLMPLTSTPGVAVSYTGKSGNAKTGALYANLSIWCNPVAISVFESTSNGLNQRYVTLKNAAFGVDEAHGRSAEELSKTIHAISQGKAKIRLQGSVNAEREHELLASGIGMLTCNMPLLELITSKNTMATGEMARLIEFLIMKPQVLLDEPDFGIKVFDPLKYNYGHASRKLVPAYYQLGEADLMDRTKYWIRRFKNDFGDDAIYRFYDNLIGAAFTGGMVANEFGIITYDLERIYDKVCGEMIEIKNKVVTLGEADHSGVLGDFINKFYTGFIGINDGKVTLEPRNSLVGRIDYGTGLVYVSTTEFKKYLLEKNISTREFERNMKEKKILLEVKKMRLDAGWKQALSILDKNMNVNTYVFATEIPTDFFNKLREP